ncbi:MAG: hypothetical protein AUH85_06055 [Chloroflexi bacterium 13_1_40CM_4_68_4]|nr:MAG: hypothetical protein AUH85_06055 [Chloroflexi bacterium 13_1_40CM_4_68_4]
MDALVAIVGSESRARVLATLFADPPREYYQRELARSSGLALQSVQRELSRLDAAGLLRVRTVGGRRLYSADPSSSVHEELRRMTAKLRGVGTRIARSLKGDDGVDLAWIFGSYAAGTAQAASDVDVMVIGTVSPDAVRRKMRESERELDRTVNEHIISPAEWRARVARADAFIRELRRSAKIWLVGNDDALHRLERRRHR